MFENWKSIIRDAFITGLQSNLIRQRLLENKTLDFKTMFDQVQSLESAMKSSELYNTPNPPVNAAVTHTLSLLADDQETKMQAATAESNGCYFCGNSMHPCSRCSQDVRRKATLLMSVMVKLFQLLISHQYLPLFKVQNPSLKQQQLSASVAYIQVTALFDSGSTESFIHPNLVKKAGLTMQPSSGAVCMESTNYLLSANVIGTCKLDILTIKNRDTKTFNCQSSQDFVPTLYWV